MRHSMKRTCWKTVLLFVLAPLALRAQAPARPALQQLSELLTPVNVTVTPSAVSSTGTFGTREVRIRWSSGSASTVPQRNPAAGVFSSVDDRRFSERARQPEAPELGPGRLFIVALDRTNNLKSWTTLLDPRVVRAEIPGPDGVLSGTTLYLEQTEFFVAMPDDPQIAELRIYEPRSENTTLRLEQVASIVLSR